MRSDIIYKIGTAEFRKRYIDPAIKSGKVSYDYKLRWGTQAFREKCMEIVLGEDNDLNYKFELGKNLNIQYIGQQYLKECTVTDDTITITYEVQEELPDINTLHFGIHITHSDLGGATFEYSLAYQGLNPQDTIQGYWQSMNVNISFGEITQDNLDDLTPTWTINKEIPQTEDGGIDYDGTLTTLEKIYKTKKFTTELDGEIRNSLSILTISYMFQQHGPSGAKVTINPGYMTATIKIKK